MKRGLNQVTIIGTVGNDPETRYFANGNAVTKVSVATSESWKNKTTGAYDEKTQWHRLSFMDRGKFELGRIAGEKIRKGDKIHIVGSIEYKEWEKDGVKKYMTEIRVDDFENHTKHAETAAPAHPTQEAPRAAAQPPATDAGNFDNDIPF